MFKGEYITIPNILSMSRLVLLPILFLLIMWDMKEAFLISYILLGSTDFFDGFIARRFNQKTEIGKTLDSFADIFFYVSTAYFIYALFPEYLIPNRLLLIIFFSLFFLSFVISGVLCKKPIMMHTYLLKLNGILVYFLVVTSYFFNTTAFITVILLIYLVGFVEEIGIFIKYGEVDPDTPSFISLKNK
ncbi:MAG: CDP-alcohol phosphatidyltransferase family protein [Vallitaleaceae bacterium]|jgi:cardiolipin synthase|nr:CDP-alcohol phosphatidyltransferase family protein [Vallitaleaceae bacterium]